MTVGARIMAFPILGLVLVLGLPLGLAACKPASGPTIDPVAAEPSLEQLYTAGRHGEVVLLAAELIDADPEDRQAVARARFFRAMSWLAQDRQLERARGLLELRTLEAEYADSVWGRIAGAYAGRILRTDLLQEAVLELTLDLRDLEQHIRTLEQSLTEAQTKLEERDTKLAAVERERDQLRVKLDQAAAQAKLTASRITELEEELNALKQVDMQREP